VPGFVENECVLKRVEGAHAHITGKGTAREREMVYTGSSHESVRTSGRERIQFIIVMISWTGSLNSLFLGGKV